MTNEKIFYFAYGSNMLPQRLLDRCPSVVALGAAFAHGHYISFGKAGRDGSGKAAIIRTGNHSDVVYGVLYEMAKSELADLDVFEVKYKRNDDFEVIFNDKAMSAITYYIPKDQIEIGLLPKDWYRDICVAGARLNGLKPEYITKLESLIIRKDPDNPAHKYLQNLSLKTKI